MSDEPSIEFPYPSGTPGADFKNNGGRYLHNLTVINKAALVETQQWVKADNINLNELCCDILHSSLLLLRYLRANNFNVKKTKKHMLNNIEWRKEQRITELMKLSPEQILGCKLSDLMDQYPHWHFGYDKTGRPLLFKQQGEFNMKAIKALCGGSFDRVVRYHIWEQELIGRMCYEQSLRTHTIVETITVVLDVKGMTMSSFSSDFRSMSKAMIAMDQDSYPETLGKILIINAPSVFPMIWGMMKPWFDAITAAKVTIQGTDYKAKLFDSVGAENLPSTYLGLLPALSKSVHPYAEAVEVLGLLEGLHKLAADISTCIGTSNTTTSGAETAPPDTTLGDTKLCADAHVSVFTSCCGASSTNCSSAGESDAAVAVATAEERLVSVEKSDDDTAATTPTVEKEETATDAAELEIVYASVIDPSTGTALG